MFILNKVLEEDLKAILNHKNTLNKGLEVLLFIVAFSIPFSKAFNSIVLVLLFLYSFIWYTKFSFTTLKKELYTFLYFLAFFLILAIGTFYATDKTKAFSTLTRSIVFLTMPITFYNLQNKINKRKLHITLYGLLIGVLIIIFSAHIAILIKEQLTFRIFFFEFVRANFTERAIVNIHTPYFGLLTVFVLITIFKLPFLKNKKYTPFFRVFLILYLVVALYQIAAFMSILIASVFLMVQFLFLIKKSKKASLAVVLVTLLMLGSIIFNTKNITEYNRGNETIFSRINIALQKGDPVRKANWKSVVQVIKQNWIFGVGTDGGLEFLQQHRAKLSEPYVNKHNTHNQFLEILLRYGIVGFLIFLTLMFSLLKQGFNSSNYYFQWFLVVFFISCITESLLQRQIGLVFFSFFSCMFLVLKKNKD